jgi:hypothetical protein
MPMFWLPIIISQYAIFLAVWLPLGKNMAVVVKEALRKTEALQGSLTVAARASWHLFSYSFSRTVFWSVACNRKLMSSVFLFSVGAVHDIVPFCILQLSLFFYLLCCNYHADTLWYCVNLKLRTVCSAHVLCSLNQLNGPKLLEHPHSFGLPTAKSGRNYRRIGRN